MFDHEEIDKLLTPRLRNYFHPDSRWYRTWQLFLETHDHAKSSKNDDPESQVICYIREQSQKLHFSHVFFFGGDSIRDSKGFIWDCHFPVFQFEQAKK